MSTKKETVLRYDLDLPALQAFGWNTDDQHQLEAWRNFDPIGSG